MRLLSFLAFASLALAQTANKIAPDCDIQFTLTGAGSSPTTAGSCAQNLQGVRFWSVIYQSNGFSGLTLTMQEAPDSNGTPGSWTTFTAASGTNPMTSTTGVNADTTYLDYAPWVRVTLSGLSGSGKVTGHIYGCKQPGCGSGGSGSGGGGGGSTCAGTFAAPCENQIVSFGTTNSISLTSSGLTRIITHSASKTTYVGLILIGWQSAVTAQFEYGTTVSTACDTGTTALTGTVQPITGIAADNPFQVPAGQDLCVNQGASVTGGGWVTFTQQ